MLHSHDLVRQSSSHPSSQQIELNPSSNSIQKLHSYASLAINYNNNGDFDKASELYTECYDLLVDMYGDNHLQSLLMLNNVAGIHFSQSKYNKALEIYEQLYMKLNCLIERYKRKMNYIQILNNLAYCYQVSLNHELATNLYTECYHILLKAYGKDNTATLDMLSNVATAYCYQGKYEQAVETYEACYQVSMTLRGENHNDTINIIGKIALCYSHLALYSKAGELYRKCYTVIKESFGDEHPSTMSAMKLVHAIEAIEGKIIVNSNNSFGLQLHSISTVAENASKTITVAMLIVVAPLLLSYF